MYRCVDCGSTNVAEVRDTRDLTKHKGGRVPYGFMLADGNYTFEPFITGPILVDIMAAHADGEPYRVIAQKLNAPPGIEAPAGGLWSHGSVRRVVEQGKRLSVLIPLSYVIGD